MAIKEYLVKGYLTGLKDSADWVYYKGEEKKADKDIIEIPDNSDAMTNKGSFYKMEGLILFTKHKDCSWKESFYKEIKDVPNICWQRDSVEEKKEDNVNSPSHYNKGGVECIDAIESSMTKEAFCGYLKGNVIKYMYRYENKGGVESLKKAQWYLSKLINLESV